MTSRTPVYTSKIIKAGALLRDTRAMLEEWDPARDVEANLSRILRANLFAKASRQRAADVLTIFRQRYTGDAGVVSALAELARGGMTAAALDRILYFHAARADDLLRDVVLHVIAPLRDRGGAEISPDDLVRPLAAMNGAWSAPTRRRIAQGLLATLRDFGVLQGSVRKRPATFFLPVDAFAFLAFLLRRDQPSAGRLVGDPAWGLFFLDRLRVERLFAEAHQMRLLEYHSAGPVVRIDFPTSSPREYARVILGREARAARA